MLLIYELFTYTIIICYYNKVNMNFKSMSDNTDSLSSICNKSQYDEHFNTRPASLESISRVAVYQI